jgi:hypothetical protein
VSNRERYRDASCLEIGRHGFNAKCLLVHDDISSPLL